MKLVKEFSKYFRMHCNLPVFILFTVIFIVFCIVEVTYLDLHSSFKLNKEKTLNFNSKEEGFLFFPNPMTEHFEGEKIIHLDLKGAPPKISYLLDFIPLIRKLGATGILLEYEDMFPYRDELADIKAVNAYSFSNVSALLQKAEDYNLTVIPLVQTFGHFEFVLKYKKYQGLREVDGNPEVLCPSKKKTYLLLHQMIDQVMQVHFKAKYFHIGCDEANFIGLCAQCQELMKTKKWRKDDVYFGHVRKIAQYIINTYSGVRPIVWGDRFIKHNEKIIQAHGIPSLVDAMFWNYKSEMKTFPNMNDMSSYAKFLKSIWIANAYKGATGITQVITNPEYHLWNTKAWMRIFLDWKEKIKFKGIVLTGWQRYNHFSVLCDLLPVAIPSLALNLQFLTKNDVDYDNLQESLGCNYIFPVNLQDSQNIKMIVRLKCDFPGFDLYQILHIFFNKLQIYKASLRKLAGGWLSFYNIIYNISNPVYVAELHNENFEKQLSEMLNIKNKLKLALSEVYDKHTVNEWLITQVLPVEMRLEAAIYIVTNLMSNKVWPRRPLQNNETTLKKQFHKVCNPLDIIGCVFFNIH